MEESRQPNSTKDALVKLTSSEVVQSSIKTGLEAIPIVGGSIASVLGDVLEKKFDQMMEMLKRLKDRVSEIQDQLDSDYVRRDDFISLFEQAVKEYVNTPYSVKKEFIIGLVVSSMKGPGDYYERDYFLRKVVELSAVQLELLKLYHDPEKAFISKDIDPEQIKGLGYKSVVAKYLPDTNMEVIRAAHKDLYNLGFLTTDSNVFGTVMAGSGLYIVRGRTTPLGTRFVETGL